MINPDQTGAAGFARGGAKAAQHGVKPVTAGLTAQLIEINCIPVQARVRKGRRLSRPHPDFVHRIICEKLVQGGVANQARCADQADALAGDLRAAAPHVTVTAGTDASAAANGVDGLINCTPVGMVGKGGTPLASAAMSGAKWAFDAVYTPVETAFLIDAAAAGLSIISGWEVFFYQGVHAWALFTGLPLDETRLRQDLL